MKLTKRYLKSLINEELIKEYEVATSYKIDKIPSNIFTIPPQRSTNIIQQGFQDTHLKYPPMVPIGDRNLLKTMLKVSRKKDTIDNIEKIWGLEVGKKYILICLDYLAMGGFKPKRIILFKKKPLRKIADSTSAKGIAEQVKTYLEDKKK